MSTLVHYNIKPQGLKTVIVDTTNGLTVDYSTFVCF